MAIQRFGLNRSYDATIATKNYIESIINIPTKEGSLNKWRTFLYEPRDISVGTN